MVTRFLPSPTSRSFHQKLKARPLTPQPLGNAHLNQSTDWLKLRQFIGDTTGIDNHLTLFKRTSSDSGNPDGKRRGPLALIDRFKVRYSSRAGSRISHGNYVFSGVVWSWQAWGSPSQSIFPQKYYGHVWGFMDSVLSLAYTRRQHRGVAPTFLAWWTTKKVTSCTQSVTTGDTQSHLWYAKSTGGMALRGSVKIQINH